MDFYEIEKIGSFKLFFFFFFYSCNVGEFDVLIQSDSVAGEWT